jgi:hypothetical protein
MIKSRKMPFVKRSMMKWASPILVLAATASLVAQEGSGPGGGGSNTAPPKDNNPANPSNWEKIESTTGVISYTSYPIGYVTPVNGTQDLSVLNPEIPEIRSWGIYTGIWDLPNGIKNYRYKWIGIGPAPTNVRVSTYGQLKAHLMSMSDLTQSFTGIDNVIDASTSVDYIKQGGGFKQAEVDTLFQIGFKMKAKVAGDGGYGLLSYMVDSKLAELSTALRGPNETYHKLGELGQKELNVGEDYSNWVMDIAVPDITYNLDFHLTNMLSGPWGDGTTYKYTSDDVYGGGLYTSSLTGKDCRYTFTKEQWVDLADGPLEKTVTVEIKDPNASDAPVRTAKIRIKLHNPYENWRLARNADGSAVESLYWKEPEFKEYTPSIKNTTWNGDEEGITFKYRHSYPVIKHIQDGITGNPLLQALQTFVPIKWVPLASKAVISAASVLDAETWQGPVSASFAGKWDDPNSTFSPSKNIARKDDYKMTASVNLKYKYNAWVCDTYNHSGYTGFGYGTSDKRVPGQYVYGIFTIDTTGGGDEGGGIIHP